MAENRPFPVVLRANETPDQYEADLICRMHPHSDVMKQRSKRINFAEKRVKEILGGYVPPVTPHYATSASPFEASEDFSVGAPSHRQQPNRYISTEGIDRFPRVETL